MQESIEAKFISLQTGQRFENVQTCSQGLFTYKNQYIFPGNLNTLRITNCYIN